MSEVDRILPEGEFSLDRDEFGEIIRVNVKKIRDISQVPGIKQDYPTAPDPDQNQPHHAVISNMVDLNGDGDIHVFRQLIDKPYSRVACYSESGERVWISEKLAPGADDESGMPVFDLDCDGRYEIVLSQWAHLYCLDAHTGQIKWDIELEKGGKPGPGNWDSPMVIGHFHDRQKKAVAVRSGLHVYCFDEEGNKIWEYPLRGDTYGHCAACHDIDGDGFDELFISRNGTINAFSHDGRSLWRDDGQKNHSDNFAFGDIDGDGTCEVMYDHDGCGGSGPLHVVDGLTGELKYTVDYAREGIEHCQGFTVDNFCPDLPGLEVAVTDKDQLLLFFSNKGELLWKREVPSSLITRGDWNGDGVQDLMVFAVGKNLDPCWSVWNGEGERLFAMSFLPAPVRSHASMCGPGLGIDGFIDLDGNGRADVLVAYGPWKTGSPQYHFIAEAPED